MGLSKEIMEAGSYLERHLPGYELVAVLPTDEKYLFRVIAKQPNGKFAAWRYFNTETGSMNCGYYVIDTVDSAIGLVTDSRNKEEKMSFLEYVKCWLTKVLSETEDFEIAETSVLGHELAEKMVDFHFVDYEEAKNLLAEWDCEASMEFDRQMADGVDAYGFFPSNPFSEPEEFVQSMVLRGCQAVLDDCPVVGEHWNKKIELTSDVIEEILNYVESVQEIEF